MKEVAHRGLCQMILSAHHTDIHLHVCPYVGWANVLCSYFYQAIHIGWIRIYRTYMCLLYDILHIGCNNAWLLSCCCCYGYLVTIVVYTCRFNCTGVYRSSSLRPLRIFFHDGVQFVHCNTLIVILLQVLRVNFKGHFGHTLLSTKPMSLGCSIFYKLRWNCSPEITIVDDGSLLGWKSCMGMIRDYTIVA